MDNNDTHDMGDGPQTRCARIPQVILTICMYCKKIRDDKQSWQNIKCYITDHTVALYSHGICPDCFQEHCQPVLVKRM